MSRESVPGPAAREVTLRDAAMGLTRQGDRAEVLARAADAAWSLAGRAPSGAAVLTGTGPQLLVAAARGALAPASGAVVDTTGLPAAVRLSLTLGRSAHWPAGPAALGFRPGPGPSPEAVRLVPLSCRGTSHGLLVITGTGPVLQSSEAALEVLAALLGLALDGPGRGAWMETLVERTPDLVLLLEPDATIRSANPATVRALGRDAGDLVGRPFADLLAPSGAETTLTVLDDLLAGRREESSTEITLLHRHGGLVDAEAMIVSLLDVPSVRGLLVTATDSRERRSLEAQLSHSAGHDPVTNLPNRALLLAETARLTSATDTFTVLHVTVPDDGGPGSDGRARLVAYGERLRRSLPERAVLGRSDGEGFIVVVEGLNADGPVGSLADRILAAVADSAAGARPRGVGVGLATGRPGRAPEALLREARLAAESARTGGGRAWACFEPAMEAAAEHAAALRHDLVRAVAKSEFVLHYQPIVAAGSAHTVGFEALLRWEHPDLGLLGPARFIGDAEDSGLIVPIGFWALDEACRALARFQAVDPTLTMSVNLSARQLETDDVVGRVVAAVSGAAIDPATLCLEITESLFIHPGSPEAKRIDELAAFGARLAIDDFGTGFSSLGYLRTLPVHTVKIDRSFVTDVDQGGSRQALVKSIVGLCRALDLHTVAEGVETEGERETMAAIGCDRLQGYLFSRPVPEVAAFEFLAAAPVASR